MKKTVIVLASMLALCSVALARESTQIVGARYLGMGGCFVAAADDRSMLFANPAGVDRAESRILSIMSIVSTVNSKTFDVVGFGLDNRDKFEDLDGMPEEEQDAFFDQIVDEINYKRMNVMFSTLPFGWIERHAGGAIFTDARLSAMAFSGASNTPLADATFAQDVGGVFCYAHGWTGLATFLANRLSVGAGLKYIHRYMYSVRETMTELSDADSPEMMNGSTFGLDVGLLYDVTEGTRVGLAVYDLAASDIEWNGDSSEVSSIKPGDKQDVQPALRVGATHLWAPEAGFLASPVLFALDLAEPFDGDVTFFKKVHLGAEAAFFKPWIKARLGLSQGYPSAGLSVWMFTYAYYAAEGGRHAGQIQDHRHVFSFEL